MGNQSHWRWLRGGRCRIIQITGLARSVIFRHNRRPASARDQLLKQRLRGVKGGLGEWVGADYANRTLAKMKAGRGTGG